MSTNTKTAFIDITSDVERIVDASGIKSGFCLIHVPHTTAAVTINEKADPDVAIDIDNFLNIIVPADDNFRHIEGNSAAHIKSSLLGCGQTLIIEAGRILLGRWQAVFFCEFDGPRQRRVVVKMIGDSSCLCND